MKKKVNKHLLIVFIVLFLVVAIDLVSKQLTDGVFCQVIENVFSFDSTHNYGASWGLFAGKTWFLIILSSLFLIGVCIFDYFFKMKNMLYSFAVSFVFAGAVGNLLDRIFLGYVRDFIKTDFMVFPIFNVADIAITVGVVLMLIYIIIDMTKTMEIDKKELLNKNKTNFEETFINDKTDLNKNEKSDNNLPFKKNSKSKHKLCKKRDAKK
ncbi:MAG: signal peptidase II [Clostridia bacterium]